MTRNGISRVRRELDVDMAEVGFEAFARKMTQRKKLPFRGVLEEVALHLGVAAAVAIFVAKVMKCLRAVCRCLGGAVRRRENLVEDRLKGTKFRCEAIPRRWDRLGSWSTFRIVIRERLNSRAIRRMTSHRDAPSE